MILALLICKPQVDNACPLALLKVSGNRWVYGKGCTLAPGVDYASVIPHAEYNCVSGQTNDCQNQGSFNITYELGFGASGGLVYDTVNISNAIVPDMGVEVANVSGSYAAFPADGILGLAFRSLNTGQYHERNLQLKDIDLP